ncbi:MAG: Ada metal-binding domain-containing protein [Cystobacter sp.]
MSWSPDFLYERIVAKDRAYDGRFLTGVLTTGIYCLPSCPARKPKRENVRFFREEAEAVAAGLRPCLRCRPELFSRGEDQDRALFDGLMTRVRADPSAFEDVKALATTCGVSSTKLTGLVREHAHLSPAALLRREQVRAACGRLLSTDERVIDVGFSVGFDSEASFHRRFLARTGLSPGAYRALRESGGFLLHLPPGYRAEDVLAYHGRDPEGPAERRRGSFLAKALVLEGEPVILQLDFQARGVWCEVKGAPGARLRPGVLAAAHGALVRMLGLDSDASGLEGRAEREAHVARLVAGRRGLRVPLAPEPFQALAWAIIGQQINVSFATTLRRELIDLAGRPIAGGEGMRAHPTAAEVAALDAEALTSRRFSRSKAEYLLGAARAVVQGALPLEVLADGSARTAEERLRTIRGCGPWTARYVMMRGLGFADCVPIGDSGLSTGLQRFRGLPTRPDAKETEVLMEPFSPHRSLATCHLWAGLQETA